MHTYNSPLSFDRNKATRRPKLKPFQCVTMGNCRLPIILPEDGSPSSTAKVTMALCNATGAITGFVVTTKAPNVDIYEQCLEVAIAPKHISFPGEQTKHSYDMYGEPKMILVDHHDVGPDFAQRQSETGRFNVCYASIRSSARIERAFRRLCVDLPIYLDACGWSRTKEGTHFRFAKRRHLTLTDLNTAILRYIVDYYHQIPRGSDGKSIAQSWQEGMEGRSTSQAA
jgi:putative transposase